MMHGAHAQRLGLPQAAIRPILQRAHRDVACCASETDEAARAEARQANGDRTDVGIHKLSDDQVRETLHPVPKPGDEKVKSAVEAAENNPEEHHVKQQLSPLTSQDDIDLSIPPSPELEVNAIDPTLQKALAYQTPKPHRGRPGNSFTLAGRNFVAELKGLIVDILERVAKPDDPDIPEAFEFTLSNDAIHEFDIAHPPPGREPTPAFIKVAYDVLLYFVDRVYEGKAIERFWFLETVARMPYFSYSTCLHLYETMGWWRTGGLRLIHFAEEWNELHHLLIMEALGGDRRWQDRFLGQHAAVFYYWALVVCFLLSPKWSYKFSEMLETHAVSTYRQFIIENEAKLRTLPAPRIAQQYYLSDDPYLYNMDSALCRGPVEAAPREPICDNLYDVFVNILEDEWEHVKTMVMCQDYDMLEALKVTQTQFSTNDVRGRRELWNRWARDINDMDRMIELRKW